MPYIITIIIIALVAVVVYFFQKKAKAPYNIIVLGHKEAGKTVLLASMYYKLSIQDPKVGFSLELDEKKQFWRNKLDEYRKGITDAKGELPKSNLISELKEWKFICKVRSTSKYNKCYSVMRFTYLDFSGERIKLLYDGHNHTPEFRHVLNKADVFLGILDGQELLKLMRNPEQERARFYQEYLDPILDVLKESKQPIHFLITKWDLLIKEEYLLKKENERKEGDLLKKENLSYSLGEILTLLEAHPRFRNFLVSEARSKRPALRLFPVSALGPGFVKLQPDGTMGKIPGVLLRPFLVEMPLVSVLYDRLEADYQKHRLYRWFSNLLSSQNISDPMKKILGGAIWILGMFSFSLGVFSVSPQVFSYGILNLLEDSSGTSNANQEVRNKSEAAKQVIDGAWEQLYRLEQACPESNLTKYIARFRP